MRWGRRGAVVVFLLFPLCAGLSISHPLPSHTRLAPRLPLHRASLPPSGSLAKRLLREGEEELVERGHPDMYTVPYMPGGSKFMRNSPVPLEAIFPDGIPPEFNIARKDVNGIQVPMSAQPEGMRTVLIDFMTKSAK